MIGVTPRSGSLASSQDLFAGRLRRARSVNAARSFRCAAGKPKAVRIDCASSIRRDRLLAITESREFLQPACRERSEAEARPLPGAPFQLAHFSLDSAGTEGRWH